MEYNRSSNDIMKEMLSLLSEYNQAKEYENKTQRDRINYLEHKLYEQEDRMKSAARILLGD